MSKAAAYSVPADRHKERHIIDIAVLAVMIERSDHIREQLTKRDRHYLNPALAALTTSRRLWASIDGAARGIELLGAKRQGRPTASPDAEDAARCRRQDPRPSR